MRFSLLSFALLGLAAAQEVTLSQSPGDDVPDVSTGNATLDRLIEEQMAKHSELTLITTGVDIEEETVKRDRIVSTTSANLKKLERGVQYAVSFPYMALYTPSPNTCRIQVYYGGASIGNTEYFQAGFSAATQHFKGAFTATGPNGKIEARVVCRGKSLALVMVGKIDSKKDACCSSTSSLASSTSTSTRSSTTASSTTSAAAVSTSSTTSVVSAETLTSSASSQSVVSSGSVTSLTSSVETSTSTSSSTSSTVVPSSSAVAAGVDSTVLIIAADEGTASSGSLGLLGSGIPYEHFIVPKDGAPLPQLNSSATRGNYGGIIIMDSVSYEYSTGWNSAITPEQWTVLYAYQVDFNVRMVRINEYPGPNFGSTVTSGGGCCGDNVEQSISFTDTSDFPTANLKTNAGVTTSGLWHVPATISDPATTKQVAKFSTATGFDSETVAAVINTFNGREQFVWFIGWAPVWSATSSYLQHAHIHWMTRGLFLGKRKVHLSCQIDDMQIATELYYPKNGPDFKIEIADLEAHVEWQRDLNRRLPTGSEFYLELGHNGNGDLISATLDDEEGICEPDEAVYYDSPEGTALEFQKPLGTGEDIWPPRFEEYSWSKSCAKLDDFASWFMVPGNRDQFGHVSHTFTHLGMNNATYHDAAREIRFNQDWMAQTTIDQAKWFSAHGLIPPAITGMHNGDAIRAWLDNGITHVVGDNTRPVLRNTVNSYWPLISTVQGNGYAGLTIVPRFSTAIYFNCHTMECTLREWIATSAGSGDYFNLLAVSKGSTMRNLFALMSDPYMFHQANMHQTTVEPITIGTKTGKMSMVMSWTETMVQEMMRLTNWPIKTIKHDDVAQYFLDRKAVDACNPKMTYIPSSDGTHIASVTITANNNQCSVPIPVTIPSGTVSATGGSTTRDQVGSEPPIQWVTLRGSPVTLQLSAPVSV